MKRPIIITEHHGGLALSEKQGIEHSFAYGRHLDFRKNPTALTILPKTVKETGSTVTGLVTEMIQLPSGKMVAIDSSGGVYTRATDGTWTKDGTVLTSTCAGMTYNLQQDTIYIPGNNVIHSITNADGRFGGSFTVNEAAIGALLDQSATSHAKTYSTTNAIDEGATHKLSVTPTIEPLYSIKLWITTKGADAVTVTMHDAANNVLGSKTIAAASLNNGALNEFVFAAPIRTTVKPNGATYHFHVTHATASATTVGAATASDFSTAQYETYASRLVNPTNGLHPTMEFMQYMLICNERYVSAWEIISQSAPAATELNQHRIIMPSGYQATSIAQFDEYAAIAFEKRSTSATNEFQEGKIILWDGISTTYNRVIDVPEGSPYSLFSQKNILYWFAGGGWWAWAGGNPVKICQMPDTDFEYTDAETYLVNYPHMMTVRNGILLGGFPSETNSTNIEHGVYSFGARNKNYDDSIGFSYSISTGTLVNGTLRIGMVKSFGDKLFISWRDGANYGVDLVSPSSDPFSTAVWESLIIDNGRPDKEKLAVNVKVEFETLPIGATVTPKYKIDRAGSWTSGTAAVAGDTSVTMQIHKRYKELELGLDFTATTVTPKKTSFTFIYDDLASERD